MAKKITGNISNGILSILMLLIFIFSSVLIKANPPLQQITQTEFSKKLREAYFQNNAALSDSLIREHRLFVKPFVNDLITEIIKCELKLRADECLKTRTIAEKTARAFENIFGEKSLVLACNYLNSWTNEEKKKKLVADSLYALGTKFRLAKETVKAIGYLQDALDLYFNIRDERGEAEVLGGLGAAYFDQDFQKSLYWYQQALTKRVEVDDRQLIGNTLNSLGSVDLNFSGDFVKAICWFNKAETIRTEIGDLPGWRVSHSYKAIAYLSLGDLLTNQGKYTEALQKLDTALQLNIELEKRTKAGEVMSHIGFVYSRLGNYNAAIEKLTESAKIMREENDSLGLAGVYNNLGVTLQGAGRTEKALDYYNNSLDIYRKNNKPDMMLPIMNNMGTIFFDRKEYGMAEDYHTRALQLCRDLEERDQEVNLLLNLSNDQTLLGKPETALINYESAFKIARAQNSPDLIWKIFAGMAEIHKMRKENDKVVQLNDSALKIIENMRNTLQDNELQASFLASERFAFEDIIIMLAKLDENEKKKGYDKLAFSYAEQCKSRVLLDLLSESKNKKEHSEGYNENSGNDFLSNAEPVSLDEAKLLCQDKNTVILDYMVGDSSSCLWELTRSAHRLVRLPGRRVLQEQIESFRFALSNPDKSNYDFFTKGGYLLYQELLEPAVPYLGKKSRLVIIPDGILNYLPFEVLLTDNKGTSPSASYEKLPYLVKKYPVSYAQSASVLKSLLKKRKVDSKTDPGDKKLLAFGDPVYESESSTGPGSYKRLEASGKEIENIASLFKKGNTDIYLRNDASEVNVKRKCELKKFNYVHFATHGFIDEAKPDFSSLVLSKIPDSEEDGFLHAKEIYNLNLNAELVVLSACQTGLGKLVRGEGIVGLTRAFMYAGTPAVMVSLWSVSDASTATLMGEFYRNLIKEKLSKTDALRKAQLYMLGNEKFAHPFYWAPFVLIGDWR